ncbi:MAG: CCA tRNA nucleotidyltransferase [Novosphingobium sp.]|nr:CCA tRNA nucleotidyltransferase [Novosphingobium sp.]
MSERLPPAAWTSRADLARMVAALGSGTVRYVGGAVRDTLLGGTVNDIDCATVLIPADVIARLEAAGIRTIPTGIAHGTVTALLEGGNVEITTLRHDLETDGRRAEVAYSTDWREDAARRDFTINALYADPETLELFDYFGGLADLAARRVRFIGDADQRIKEDHLRILRYFRFQARFGAEPDAEAEQACTRLRETMKGLSRERVGWELLTLLALPDPTETVQRMHELAIWQVVMPETCRKELQTLEHLVRFERDQEMPPKALRRLAAVLPPFPHIAEAAAARLRLSGKQRKHLSCLAAREEADAHDPRALAYREGLDCAIDRLLLGGHPVDTLRDWRAPDLPIKGRDIIAAGIEAGPQVARVLRSIEDAWIAEHFPPEPRVRELLAIKVNETKEN